MGKPDLKAILRGSAEAVTGRTDRVRVLVDLTVAEPDQGLLDSVRAAGLSVDQVIHNKLVGSIRADQLAKLKEMPQVRQVEISTTLQPHGQHRPS